MNDDTAPPTKRPKRASLPTGWEGTTDGKIRTSTTMSTPSSKWTHTPISLLIRTLGYMDNASLIAMCLVCKQFCTIIQDGHGMDHQLIRVFELRAAEKSEGEEEDNRLPAFILNMQRYFENPTKHRILAAHQKIKVYDMQKFMKYSYPGMDMVRYGPRAAWQVASIIRTVRMMGVVELDISSSEPIINGESIADCFACSLPSVLSLMLPNLRKLDCSNIAIVTPFLLEEFAQRCPRLEVIKRNNIEPISSIAADGEELSLMHDLKEVYLDNCYFEFNYTDMIDVDSDHDENESWDSNDSGMVEGTHEYNAMRNLHPTKYRAMYLFYKLCDNPLQRVSIRNARYYDHHTMHFDDDGNVQEYDQGPLDQNILVKFIRNAPSTLTWFRSDLSARNIRLLQLEKPQIQFVN